MMTKNESKEVLHKGMRLVRRYVYNGIEEYEVLHTKLQESRQSQKDVP